MKIVMLCDFYIHTLQYQENLLVKYYIKQGHEVTIITATFESIFDYMADKYDKNIPAHEFFDSGAKIVKLPFSVNILNRIRKLRGVGKILEREQPDIIFLHDIMLNIYEVKKYKVKHQNCKIILDCHADYSNSGKNWLSRNILHKVIRKSFLYLILKDIEKIYPIVPYSFTFLNELYGIPYNRMELLPLGTDTDKFNEIISQNKRGEIREKLGIPTDAFVIFTGGKLDSIKKTDILIEAFKNLSDPRIHLIIVGKTSDSDASYKAKLEALMQNDKNIHLTGWLNGDGVYEYMSASDIGVFPASQSVLWQQAIGMGLPLIIGPHKGQDISYLNIYNCLIILGKNQITIQEIEKNIKKLMNDTVLLEEMKKAAFKTSNEYLSYDRIAKETLNFNNK